MSKGKLYLSSMAVVLFMLAVGFSVNKSLAASNGADNPSQGAVNCDCPCPMHNGGSGMGNGMMNGSANNANNGMMHNGYGRGMMNNF